MKRILLLVVACVPCLAQTQLTIPAHQWTQPVTVNGVTVSITIKEPAQVVTLPPSGGGTALPSGLTWANGVFTVAGSVAATSVSMTGGPALPTCATNLYLWKFVAASGSTPAGLQPACYGLPVLSLP